MNRRQIRTVLAMAFSATLLAACGSASSDATPTPVNAEGTRIAATLMAFPTAAQVSTATPAAPPTAPATETAAATLPPPPTETPNVPAQQYTVQAGDALSTIAARFNTSIAALQLANNLGEAQNIRLGAKLTIPGTKLADDESVYWFVYVVKAGDNVSTIAARFRVNAADILRVNKITDASRVLVDQKLIIPVKTPVRTEDLDAPDVAAANQPRQPSAAATIATVSEDLRVPAADVAVVPLVPLSTPGPINGPVLEQPRTSSGVSQASPAIVAASADLDNMRGQLLALYNEQRLAAGLPTLQWSPALQAAAQAHADECAARGAGSHTGLDGSTSRDRIARAGFGGRFTGENWAWSGSAAGAFDMWFHREAPSDPHRRNIMSPNYNAVGFGIASSKGGYFFIANFGG
jgi:uncharacterized protein YkwD